MAPAGSAEEREAEAAADALLTGRPFAFARASDRSARPAAPVPRVIQRYMAWEHCVLGDLDPARVSPEHLEAQCALLERLCRDPPHFDEERLRAEHPGLDTLRLPGSGLVVTLGELNVLPDYLAHPAEIETAPEAFLLPLIQSIRSMNIAELRRSAGRPAGRACREIFDGFPSHVEQEGRLVTLRQWHDDSLHDLCFGELFSLWRTGATRILASAIFRRFGVPSPDVEALSSAHRRPTP